MVAEQTLDLDWWPQQRQAVLFKAAGLLDVLDGGEPRAPAARALGYGGAAGGGKSDAAVALGVLWALAFRESSVGFFRRKFTELEGADGAIQRSQTLLAPARDIGLASYNTAQHTWRFATGSILKFCHCEHAANRFDYQSQAFDLLIIDEATHFTWEIVDYLMTRNRLTRDWIPQPLAVFLTNPGNIGHLWFKGQFATQPPEKKVEVELPSGETETRFFIPAKLADNPILDRRGGGAYRKTLMSRDELTRKALLEGDWDIFVGQMFTTWRKDRHVCRPFEIPSHWPKWRAVDWGRANPFCCLWLAQHPDIGRVFVYRSVYEVGLTDRQQARLILTNSPASEKLKLTYADPSMWTKKTHEDVTFSSADEYAKEGVVLTRADNDRMTGVRKVHNLLADLPDGLPGLVIFDTCDDLVRTLPALPRDEANVEDVDSESEDHAYDALRYGLTAVNARPRPLPPAANVADALIARLGKGKTGLASKDL